MAVEMINRTGRAYQGSGAEVPSKKNKTVIEPATEPAIKKIEGTAERIFGQPKEFSNKEGVSPPISGEQVEAAEQRNDAVGRAVEEINKKMKNSEAIFGIHDSTNRVTIKIVDKETKEVIKEFPPEETLDMIAKVWELAGIMIDEKG